MHPTPLLLRAALLWLSLLAACSTKEKPAPVPPGPEVRVLVFHKTTGFRHSSIPAGIAALEELGRANGFRVVATDDAGLFRAEELTQYRAVVFLNTTQDVLNDAQQAVFEQYIRGGRGFVGVHAATDTEYDWPWYTRLVGATFDGHPAVQPARVRVADKTHPATAHLPDTWPRTDEWYNFRNLSPTIRVLAYLDESSYTGGTNGANHPIAWYHAYDGGRAFYTAGGHTEDSYAEPLFRQHLLGGIRYALGQ